MEQTNSSINYKVFFPIVLAVFTLGQVAADIYVPSMPDIVRDLHSTRSIIQYTMALYMVGFSLSQLVYGPISDYVGRRKIILIGLSIGCLGSIVCLLAKTPTILIMGRLVQGLGMGVCASLGRSVLRDVFSGDRLAKVASFFGIGTSLMMACSPVIGSYIHHSFNWRGVFITLALYIFGLILAVWGFLPETNINIGHKVKLSSYWMLLTNKVFLGYAACTCLGYAGFIAYFTMSPFILQTDVGLSVVAYGWFSSGVILAVLFGGVVNGLAVLRMGINRMLFIGALLMLISGGTMFTAVMLDQVSIYTIFIPTFIFVVGADLMFCNAFAGAFTPFPDIVGMVGALYGCLQIVGGLLSSAVIAGFKLHGPIDLSVMFFVLGILVLFALQTVGANDHSP